MPFDPFRRFRRPVQLSTLPSSTGDSDESSPEREHHIIRVPALKHARRSEEHRLSITEIPKLSRSATDTTKESTHIPFTLDKPSHHDWPSKKSSTLGVANVTCPIDTAVLQPSEKPTLMRRVTSKLNIIIPPRSHSQVPLRSRPSTRTLPHDSGPPPQGPRAHKTIHVSPTLPNGFISKQHREAALRERGLLPPRKDLSEQEREADERLGLAPLPTGVTPDGSTEAERLKADWLATNRTSDSSVSERGPPVPPQLQSTRPSWSHPDANVLPRPSEGKPDLPPAGRPSCSSSVPALSNSSHLEVLPEEPSELPITPLPHPLSRANLPIIVSSSLESPPSPFLVESPISCTFSSHCPGSTLESQSQSSHRLVPEKEDARSSPSRSRTNDSGDRSRRLVGSSLSGLGARSLSNLRRSVAGSLRVQSSSTLSSADHASSPTSQAPRAAIDPTMHSLGSILRETRGIEDAESRRLSELAFLN